MKAAARNKSHFLFLNGFQTVYVARNPKDVIVSYYHHHKLVKLHDFTGTLDEFAQYFMDDKGTCD